ncbi:hypothetical protein ABAC460_06180 [Asticcacaulis sp. AC460]|uniref:hypothetical protein n=1 Tax=Asticcacaulis sp. AC460 TaxID=1282360 RepID=UPI0003C3F448|nr:hypothetical protein [Asticcacaulis sp. AC460]ESQ91571.1 hypothetical protein ABAC460_06180 [Asticcacaulis sp. AC460]
MLDKTNPETDLDLDDQAGDVVGENILNEDENEDETGIGVIDDLSTGDTDSENETGMITPAL